MVAQRGVSSGLGSLAPPQIRTLPAGPCNVEYDFTCVTGGTLWWMSRKIASAWPTPVQAITAGALFPGNTAEISPGCVAGAVVPALLWHTPSQSTAESVPTLCGGWCGDEGPTSPLWGTVHSQSCSGRPAWWDRGRLSRSL